MGGWRGEIVLGWKGPRLENGPVGKVRVDFEGVTGEVAGTR